jgi:hypothetical protein
MVKNTAIRNPYRIESGCDSLRDCILLSTLTEVIEKDEAIKSRELGIVSGVCAGDVLGCED